MSFRVIAYVNRVVLIAHTKHIYVGTYQCHVFEFEFEFAVNWR